MNIAEKFQPVLIQRQVIPDFVNKVANHPKVRPGIGGGNSYLDATALVNNPNNFVLFGEYGGMVFEAVTPGMYEIHTQVLPEGRGNWCTTMVHECFHWMFTRTDAVELVTKVPKGNLPALALTKQSGLRYEFTRPNAWEFRGRTVPVDIFTISIQHWATLDSAISHRGRWVTNRIKKELRKADVDIAPQIPDENADRYVGAAFDMILSGQVLKGLSFYNRWATLARYLPATMLSNAPVTIDFRGIMLIFRNNDFWVVPCR